MNHITSILLKDRAISHTHKRRLCDPEAQTGDAATSKAKECRQPPEARRGRNSLPPKSLQREWGPANTLILLH